MIAGASCTLVCRLFISLLRSELAGRAPLFIRHLSRASLRADRTLHWRSSYWLPHQWQPVFFTGFYALCLLIFRYLSDHLLARILHSRRAVRRRSGASPRLPDRNTLS